MLGNANKGETGYGDSIVYGDNESPAGRAFLDFGEKVVSLSDGGYTDLAIYCALTESSQIYCWGNGEIGGLLRGSTDNTFVSNRVTDFPPLSVWSPVQKRPDEVLADDLQFWFDSSDRSTIHNNAT